MSVPEEIRRVPRPPHTVVEDIGSGSAHRYAVKYRERTKAEDGSGSRITSRVIGYIIDGAYVPKPSAFEGPSQVTYLTYGVPALIHSCCGGIRDDLEELFPGQSNRILALVSLLIQYPLSSLGQSLREYPCSYLSRYFPCGEELTTGEVSALLESLEGKQEEILSFMRRRVQAVSPKHHIVISGIYDEGQSRDSSMDWVLVKPRHRYLPMDSDPHHRYFLYAFDLEGREILCWRVFHPAPPTRQDCLDFLEACGLDRDMVLTDPASLMQQVEGDLAARPNLHPLALKEAGMPEEIDLNSVAEFLGLGEMYASSSHKSDQRPVPQYDSDRTFSVSTIKRCSASRDLAECLLGRYIRGTFLTLWKPQASFPVAVEFLGLLAGMLSYRMVAKAFSVQLLSHESFGNLMLDLGEILRAPHAPDPPRTDDGYWLDLPPQGPRILEKLGLADRPAPRAPRRRRNDSDGNQGISERGAGPGKRPGNGAGHKK